MKYIYLLILCTIIAMIISFRNYKCEMYSSLTKKEAPLKLFYGFAMVISVLINKFSKNHHTSSDKLNNRLKSISFGICSFTIIMFFGFLYTFTATDSTSKNEEKGSSHNTELVVEADTEATSGTEHGDSDDSSFLENESYNKIKNTISIFEDNRDAIEKTFLNGNESCLSVKTSLNLISVLEDTDIHISWSFEPDNVIDSQGNIIIENISSDGCSTLAYAKLTLDDVSATLTIPVFICPP